MDLQHLSLLSLQLIFLGSMLAILSMLAWLTVLASVNLTSVLNASSLCGSYENPPACQPVSHAFIIIFPNTKPML